MKEEKITFDDIQKANETIKTTNIKGNDYAEVNQRIKAFRMLYPDGCIKTEMISNKDGVCEFKAYVYEYYLQEPSSYFANGVTAKLLATGTAYEKEDSSFINKTSYIENCETSAVGRALGMCGLGIDTSISSAEEMQNAINNENKKVAKASPKQDEAKATPKQDETKATPTQVEVLKKYYTGANLTKLLKLNKINKIEDISLTKASELISKMKGNK